MAPREKKDVDAHYAFDDNPKSKVHDCSVNGSATYTNYKSDLDDKETLKQRVIFFRIGPLRFGVHGVAGILGTIFVSYALILSHHNHSISTWLSIAIVISTVTSSLGSYSLLSQVPKQSHITSWIFPPHREAFKRTIAIIGYLNLRLVHQWQWTVPLFHNDESFIFPIVLLLYTNYYFFPFRLDYKNGNTWFFIVPMFVGFNIDSMHQFPRIDSFGDKLNNILMSTSISHFKDNITVFSSCVNYTNWDDVHHWNQNKVNESYLLLTLLCALQIAFMFTVAFRGWMSIRYCYWIAVIEVGMLCVRLFNTT